MCYSFFFHLTKIGLFICCSWRNIIISIINIKRGPLFSQKNHPASRTSTTTTMYLQDFEKTFSAAAAAAGASSSMDYSYLNQSTFDAAASALTGTMDGGTFPLALFHDIFSNLLLDATTHLYEWSLPFVGSCVPK